MKKTLYIVRLVLASLVFVMTILAFTTIFYPVHFLNLHFSALLQKTIFGFSVITAVCLILFLLFTIFFGRFYCSVCCPFGFLQELAGFVFHKKNTPQKNMPYKYFISAVGLGALIGGSAMIIRYFEPYAIFGSAVTLSVWGVLFAAAVLIFVFFKNRFFCSNICPVGALLGVISKFSPNKIYLKQDECVSCKTCEKNCPTGCIDIDNKKIDNETCVRCLKCIASCPKSGINYGIQKQDKTEFSLKRRELILSASILVLFGAAAKAGLEFSKNIGKKLKNFILPPGAINEQHLINKCFNCNLCVTHCPNQIIEKANGEFPVVHINYEKGKQFCKFDCNECSKVCPTGAIKRIDKQDKQNTRIAVAVVKPEECRTCGICSYDCPVNAIEYTEGNVIKIDASKCIGCGQCRATCPYKAIDLFAVKEQRVV